MVNREEAGANGPSGLRIYLALYFTFQAEHLSGQEGLLAPALKKAIGWTL
jgi:hypothetical protein